MYNTIRLIIGCIFLGSSLLGIKKSNIICKRTMYIIFTVLSIALFCILVFLPFENWFFVFKSPEDAYKYYNLGEDEVELVIEGNHSDFVVDCKEHSYTYLIIPKTADGWKIGTGLDTKNIYHKFYDGISIDVYQYKNTEDYYITIFDARGGKISIFDDYDTEFVFLENKEEKIVTYYGFIPKFNSQYDLEINGNKIELRK